MVRNNNLLSYKVALLVLFLMGYTSMLYSQEININQIERRNRIAYQKGKTTPFTGKAVEFYKNGIKKSEETFVNGLRDGIYKTWFENGKQESQKTYKANKLSGQVTAWYENGTLERKVEFSDDKKHGAFVTYHENGKLKEQGQFVNGKKTGTFRSWFENGNVESECFYENGQEEGLYVEYFENGKKYCEKKYKAGEELTVKYWTETGRQMTIEEVNEMIKQMQSGNLMQQWQMQGGK